MNVGFEEENICSEYSKNCAPEGWISTSLYADYYFDDAPNAFEGQHFVGLVLARTDRQVAKHFLRSRLLCGLRKGAQYQLEFYIRSKHPAFDSIGVYFSANDFLYQKEKLRGTKPQVFLKDVSQLMPSKEWQKISFSYTATGDENFISIGDFKPHEHSFDGLPDLGKDYYFFIDSLSLTPLNPQEHLCKEAAAVQEDEYNFDVRHNLLDRLVYVYTKKPPPVNVLPKTILQRVDTLVIPDVLFATNSFSLGEEAKELLMQLVQKTKASTVDSVVVEGHTDSQGNFSSNQILSENRAASVASYMEPLLQASFYIRGWASTKPVADNRTAEGRQKNRRVEIYVYLRE
ncbi:MAG TPA: OmpA family protein [Flavisolibacter sp.]|nr:OmpA family protein [Flavisolibacter sp.]